MRSQSDTLTPREIEEFRNEKELAELQAQYQLRFKTLELEIKKTEMKFSQLYRLPILILLLPVRLLFGLAYIVHVIRKSEPSDKFWDFITSSR